MMIELMIGFLLICSDPFVKLQVISGQKVVKTKKTSTKKNTLDPVFNETFSFHVTTASLSDVSLLVSVWDYNTKSKDYFTGQIIMGKFASGNRPPPPSRLKKGPHVCSPFLGKGVFLAVYLGKIFPILPRKSPKGVFS